jgi:hypothetical protein
LFALFEKGRLFAACGVFLTAVTPSAAGSYYFALCVFTTIFAFET